MADFHGVHYRTIPMAGRTKASTARTSRPVRRGPRATAAADRVLLRHPLASDFAEYKALRAASAAHLRPWEPRAPDGKEPRASQVFRRLLASADTEACQRFFICGNEDGPLGGRILGQISFNQIFRGPFQNAIAGYWIGKAYAGQGYMTEALRLALSVAFDTLKLHRVEANIIPRNEASLAVARKLGFRYEGLAKRYLQIAGRWQDHEHWAMTVEDWAVLGRARGTFARTRGDGGTRTIRQWSSR